MCEAFGELWQYCGKEITHCNKFTKICPSRWKILIKIPPRSASYVALLSTTKIHRCNQTFFVQQLLSQFISPHTGHIFGRHITGLCGRKQRAVSKAIKRAHIMGFMPVTYKDPAFLKDPKICEP
ncbi:28S ribosomal protein S18c, mitochondrial isoform X1 [Xenopus tropicalis]|uniref:Small ribosomal subunit protein bS18m n=1 Tax=Xenopus tropicalis TaxID=8364 RepID=A0A8J0SP75_XENTR|nr:28S ribosomal protein S18c, mitochondrial isoform X1 [Xenopus tropicalis]|eukprot:XP_012818739.1 PREDICTED: 28S ribosomal protein S18c, mitochondrial isoform X1 [Xenopus tropicalis]